MTTFEPKKRYAGAARWLRAAAVAALLVPAAALATIDGITGTPTGIGPSFDLTAREGYISISDGGSIYSWGYGEKSGTQMQLPGPTLIVYQGDNVTVTLHNALPAAAGNVSIIFPGHVVAADPASGVPGPLTREAPPGGSVVYTFTASEAGTYQYHSGSRPDLQVEMGLYGALIVRPTTPAAGCLIDSAYNHPATCFDREYLFLLSQVDIDVHRAAEAQAAGPGPIDVGFPPFYPEYWLINGRAAPDTMAMEGTSVLPTQPYNCMPRMHPGERMLMRVVGADRAQHPYHHHGNHARVLARDGRLLLSEADSTKLAGPLLFTIPSVPGGTVDAIFEWTGKDLGWDIYGHTVGDGSSCAADANGYHSVSTDPNYREWCADHNKPLPVTLPSPNVLTFGGFWSGSPFLGAMGQLPPGEGGLNPNGGIVFMWHSHTEREMVNNDVFPGGMMTMMIIEAPGIPIP